MEGDLVRGSKRDPAQRSPTRRLGRRPDPLRDPAPLIRRIYAYVSYRVGPGADAEDMTSEVFERAVRYRETFDPAKGDSISWLVGIARRVIADRRSSAPPEVPTDVLPEVGVDGDMEDRAVLRLTLDHALEALPERDRDLLSLRYGADLKARQIAAVLEMDVHAVEVALSRALARLRSSVPKKDMFGS